jgi:hypothetical protein
VFGIAVDMEVNIDGMCRAMPLKKGIILAHLITIA